MSGRSLRASAEGIQILRKTIKLNGWRQDELKDELGLKTRQPITRVLAGEPIERVIFEELCHLLDLKVDEVAESETELAPEAEFAVLVQTVRNQVHDDIQARCGEMRVLDMTQPISLGAIYTTVNIFEKVVGRQRRFLADLLQECDFEEFISPGQVKQKRVSGLKAVDQHSKLMVLGKPGAGKTTFLKWIAIQCNNGQSRADRVPVFITLKAFAEAKGQPDLLAYLSKQWTDCEMKDPQTAERLLHQGRVLILLDGLDEVKEVDHDRVLQEIRDFSTRFRTCQFVLTCRIAAREYTFEQFTEVEVADFDDEQIADFVTKWFTAKQDSVKIERLLKKLHDNSRIRELATNPLLLTLLCWVFQELADFPTNRAELYREGLEVLLKKWDTKRNIDRDALHHRSEIYRSLSLQKKEALLSQIAFTTFERGDIFFKQPAAEKYIADFIRNLPGISDNPESLELDSEAILKSIEAQHGLLVERARGIYSFSHLTFQEYFTAKKIAASPAAHALEALESLAPHVTEKRWQEVFLLTVGILQSADDLLLLMKAQIDSLVAHDEKLQQFLTWVNEKAGSVDVFYKPAALRAYYYALACGLDLDYDLDLALDLARALDYALDLDPDLDYGLALARARALDHARARARALDYARSRSRALDYALNHVLVLASRKAITSELKQSLQSLRNQLPSPDDDPTAFQRWWKDRGPGWSKQLQAVMIQSRNIGHDWQFNEAQVERLVQYYTANQLLVDCLNSDCYVTRSVREEIEATLLSPKSLLPNTQE